MKKPSDKKIDSFDWHTDWECEDSNGLTIYEDHLLWNSSSSGHGQNYNRSWAQNFRSFLATCNEGVRSSPYLGNQPTDAEIKKIILELNPSDEIMDLDLTEYNQWLEKECNYDRSGESTSAQPKPKATYSKIKTDEASRNNILSVLEEMKKIAVKKQAPNLTEALEYYMENIGKGEDVIDDLQFFFMPTGELQDYAIASGWGDEFCRLTAIFDKTAESLKD